MFKQIKPFIVLLISGAILAACASKTPNCSADETKKILTQALAEKLKEMGISATNIDSLITISDIQVIKKDEKLDKYSCQANFAITKPAGLGDKIYKIATENEKGLESFMDIFTKKYGDIQGGTLYGSLNGMIMGGLNAMGGVISSDNEAENSKQLKSKLKELLTEVTAATPIPVSYEIFSVENNGKLTPSLTWTSSENDQFIMNVVLFKINDALK